MRQYQIPTLVQRGDDHSIRAAHPNGRLVAVRTAKGLSLQDSVPADRRVGNPWRLGLVGDRVDCVLAVDAEPPPAGLDNSRAVDRDPHLRRPPTDPLLSPGPRGELSPLSTTIAGFAAPIACGRVW